MVGQRALYPGNGAGDRSQTWNKVSSKVVLLIYSAIAIFVKIAIWWVFPDTVTYSRGSDFNLITHNVANMTDFILDIRTMLANTQPNCCLRTELAGSKNYILSFLVYDTVYINIFSNFMPIDSFKPAVILP